MEKCGAKGASLSAPSSAWRGRSTSALGSSGGHRWVGPPRQGLAGLVLRLGQVALRREGAQASVPFLRQTSLTQPVLDTQRGGLEGRGSYKEPITLHRSLQGRFSQCVRARVRISGDFCDRSSPIPERERRGGGGTGGEEKIGGGRDRRREQQWERGKRSAARREREREQAGGSEKVEGRAERESERGEGRTREPGSRRPCAPRRQTAGRGMG